MPRYTDRSRFEAFQHCPAKRFWGYEWEGQGIQPIEPRPEPVLGNGLHLGTGILIENGNLSSALNQAGRYISKYLPGLPGAQARMVSEGLLRAFEKIWLPKIWAKYDVLEVEPEETFNLSDDLIFMSRPDAILRHKIDKKLYIFSLKSTRQWNDRKEKEHLHDVQGLSEIPGVEARLGETIKGVQMFFMFTGEKMIGDSTTFGSPLIWVWENQFTGEERFEYRWKDDYGQVHTLGKDFKHRLRGKQNEIKNTLPMIPAKIIEAQFYNPPVYYRNREELQEWRDETAFQELKVTYANEDASPITWGSQAQRDAFPKYRHTCFEFGRCEFYKLCWGQLGESNEPLAVGFKLREFNHPIERTGQNPHITKTIK